MNFAKWIRASRSRADYRPIRILHVTVLKRAAPLAAIVLLAAFCRFQGASFVRSFHRQAGQSCAQAVPALFHSWRYGQSKSCGIH